MAQVIAVMFVIMTIGLFFDQLVFAPLEKYLRRQWGVA
jgi:ABC-type nitrate/sulfonate/bicarbonate transport system permease component